MIKDPWKLIYTASLILLGLLIVVSTYGFFLPKAEYTKIQKMQLLDEENVQLVILDAQLDSELVQTTRLQPEWQVDFEDDELVIFTSAKRH